MRRLTLLVLASLLTLTACTADPAVRDAQDHLDQVADQLKAFDPWVPEDVGYHLTQDEEYLTVYDVSGDGRDDPGRVRIKVRGRDRTPRGPMAPTDVVPPRASVSLCFDLEVVLQHPVRNDARVTEADRRVNVTEIDCPESKPGVFRPPARLPAQTYPWLQKHLPTTLDLEAARRAVRALNLDPRIRQDVAVFDGKIGIALREPDGDCLFARVWPSTVQVWSPWRSWAAPMPPSERACSAAQAASGYSY